MSEAMELSEQQLNQIGGYVKQILGAWMKEVVPTTDSLLAQNTFERVVRVEEELKASRQLMAQGFEYMEKRFEQVDKRFEDLRADMLSRFEQMDKRFEQVDTRFERLTQAQSRMIGWLTLIVTLVTGASTAITLLLGS
ncbi:MAG: hypothetical protein ACOC8L_08310 [Spirochaetota bacterium]